MSKNSILSIRECEYKGEHYSVREDGAIFRHPKENSKRRKYDAVWTYGTPNKTNGYMFLSNARVHIIVANAFHGIHDSKVYVVDHIDTNRKNNRPDNLRWMTRLENILLNEITRKKVVLICGSIEAFLDNPSLLIGHEDLDVNFNWMRNVSKEEADNCKQHWLQWTKSVVPKPYNQRGSIGEWIFDRVNTIFSNNMAVVDSFKGRERENKTCDLDTKESLTINALQRDWHILTEFLMCPTIISKTPLCDYENNLKRGGVFCKNIQGHSILVDYSFMDKDTILVVCERSNAVLKKWCIVVVTFEDEKYVHTNYMHFFSKEGALKYMTLASGKEWSGGDTIDDYEL